MTRLALLLTLFAVCGCANRAQPVLAPVPILAPPHVTSKAEVAMWLAQTTDSPAIAARLLEIAQICKANPEIARERTIRLARILATERQRDDGTDAVVRRADEASPGGTAEPKSRVVSSTLLAAAPSRSTVLHPCRLAPGKGEQK